MKKRVEIVTQRPLSTEEQWQLHLRKRLRRRVAFGIVKSALIPVVVVVILVLGAMPLAVG